MKGASDVRVLRHRTAGSHAGRWFGSWHGHARNAVWQQGRKRHLPAPFGRATGTGQSSVSFKSVKVKIFDLSDPKQVEAYEKLWLKLLNKIARMEAVVDARTDLVRRADGTSYWMKYVEYTEFGDDEGDSSKDRKSKGRNGK